MIRRLFHSFVSDAQLRQLYEERKALLPEEENRSFWAITLSISLVVIGLSFILGLTYSRSSVSHFLEGKSKIIDLPQKDLLRFDVTSLDACSDNCYTAAKQKTTWVSATPDTLRVVKSPKMALRAQLRLASHQSMASHQDPLVLYVPRFRFHEAEIYVDAQLRGRFVLEEQLKLHLSPRDLQQESIEVTIILTGDRYLRQFYVGDGELSYARERQFMLMPFTESEQLAAVEALALMTHGDVVGRIARLIMAIFVLALFLLIDGSPETLGLALFMGFEGLGFIFTQGWVPGINQNFASAFAFQMGDVFRLYFCLQLARLVHKDIKPWLLWGGLASLIYAGMRGYGTDASSAWMEYIPRVRDLIVGSLGIMICSRSAWYLSSQQMPWRFWALVIAGLACAEQVIEPVATFFPLLKEIKWFMAIQDTMQPAAAWLFAFSAFINISTLENRVKKLGEVAADVKQMEQEIELAQAVQNSFLTLPRLPEELDISCHHEAMKYVSGDIYFVHYDETRHKLSVVLTDVTGHGVQAALKASGVSVLAHTLWSNGWSKGLIENYGAMVQEFYHRLATTADVVAVGGIDFDAETGHAEIYRENFPFPIIIQPKVDTLASQARWDDQWVISMLPLLNTKRMSIDLPENSFIIMTSDGFVESSRAAKDYLNTLRQRLSKAPRDLSVATIKSVILETRGNKVNDDKTLAIFHFKKKVKIKAIKSVA